MSPLEDGLFFVSLWITFPGFYFSKLLESLGGGLPSMKLCKRLGYLPAGARFLQEVKTRNRSVSLGDWGKNAMKLIKQFFGFGHKSDLSFFSMLFHFKGPKVSRFLKREPNGRSIRGVTLFSNMGYPIVRVYHVYIPWSIHIYFYVYILIYIPNMKVHVYH